MVVAKFQLPNSCVFPNGVFVVEPEATLSRLEVTDDARCIVTSSSGVSAEMTQTYKRLTMLTMKTG